MPSTTVVRLTTVVEGGLLSIAVKHCPTGRITVSILREVEIKKSLPKTGKDVGVAQQNERLVLEEKGAIFTEPSA